MADFVLLLYPARGEEGRKKRYPWAVRADSTARGEEGMMMGSSLELARLVAAYADYGISPRMREVIAKAQAMGIPVEHRKLGADWRSKLPRNLIDRPSLYEWAHGNKWSGGIGAATGAHWLDPDALDRLRMDQIAAIGWLLARAIMRIGEARN